MEATDRLDSQRADEQFVRASRYLRNVLVELETTCLQGTTWADHAASKVKEFALELARIVDQCREAPRHDAVS